MGLAVPSGYLSLLPELTEQAFERPDHPLIEQADLHVLSPTEVVEKNALPDSYNGYPGWQTTILSALASANHCQSYSETKPEYELFSKRTKSSLKIIGTEEDVDRTIEVFLYCIEEVERLSYYWSPRASVKHRNDFKRGAANGIATRVLEELDEQNRSERSSQGEGIHITPVFFSRKKAVHMVIPSGISLV